MPPCEVAEAGGEAPALKGRNDELGVMVWLFVIVLAFMFGGCVMFVF